MVHYMYVYYMQLLCVCITIHTQHSDLLSEVW